MKGETESGGLGRETCQADDMNQSRAITREPVRRWIKLLPSSAVESNPRTGDESPCLPCLSGDYTAMEREFGVKGTGASSLAAIGIFPPQA